MEMVVAIVVSDVLMTAHDYSETTVTKSTKLL